MRRQQFKYRAFLDMLFGCLLILIAIIFLLKSADETTKARPPNVIYEVVLTWDGKAKTDLDLRAQAASGHIASFNAREGSPSEGSPISLDHDALGLRNNHLAPGQTGVLTEFHEEVIGFRAVTRGENIVTVHAYSFQDTEPVKCTVKLVRVKPFKEVVVKELTFESTGQQLTAFRFVTDELGNVTDINYLEADLVGPELGGQ